MKARRYYALALLAIECAVWAFFTRGYVFAAAAFVVALIHGPTRLQFRLGPRPKLLGAALLAVAFAVRLQLFPLAGRAASVYLITVGHAIGQYFLTLQVLAFYFRSPASMTPLFPFYGVVVLTCAGDTFTTDNQKMLYHAAALAFIAFTALYYGAGRAAPERPGLLRATALGFVLAIVLTSSWSASHYLNVYQSRLDALFVNITSRIGPSTTIGFSRHANLHSITRRKTSRAEKPMLRVYSQTAPGYLRGRAYDTYRDSTWHLAAAVEPIPDIQRPRFLPPARQECSTYQIRQTGADAFRQLDVWPAVDFQEVYFSTLDTVYLDTPSLRIRRGDHGVIEGQSIVSRLPYTLFSPEGPATAEGPLAPLDLATAIPAHLDPRLRELADQIYAGASGPEEKIARTVRFFHDNFVYRIGIEVPPDRDPLTYFLTERPPAHCEFFAAGAALLLRLAGVPTRYVTGFVATEYNPVGAYWIARNRDAHAWAEAYVEGRGWVIVEATPPDGVPAAADHGHTAYYWDNVLQQLAELRRAFAVGAVRDLLHETAAAAAIVGRFFLTVPGIVLLLAAVALYAARRLRRIQRKKPVALYDPARPGLTPLRSKVDAYLERRGIIRAPAETPARFAQRLRDEYPGDPAITAAADWYSRYAAVRYLPEIDETTLASLNQWR